MMEDETMAATGGTKVLVGRVYPHLNNSWAEWDGHTFDEAVQKVRGRRSEQAPKVTADEIIEVVVVRRARISSEVTVEVEGADGGDDR